MRLKKLRNLILNERERLSQVERVRSMPVTGLIDPAFACNLECPLCLSQMIREDRYTLPNMRLGQLDHILGQYGDYLVRIWLSLWGEPLLNKNLPEMIRRCKQHDIWVLISSNMSVPLDDAAIEALVASGLDTISLSIDGATQATYEQYRKRGNLGLALDNARRRSRPSGVSAPLHRTSIGAISGSPGMATRSKWLGNWLLKSAWTSSASNQAS